MDGPRPFPSRSTAPRSSFCSPGDKVQVAPAGGGRSSVRFVPADPAASGYETRTVGKDLYVVPDSAARLALCGKVDEAVFNVSGLIRHGFEDSSTDRIPVITT